MVKKETKKKKKKEENPEIDNKWEMIYFSIKYHWWKIAIIILIGGIVKGGCAFKNKFFDYTKDPIEIKKTMESNNEDNS